MPLKSKARYHEIEDGHNAFHTLFFENGGKPMRHSSRNSRDENANGPPFLSILKYANKIQFGTVSKATSDFLSESYQCIGSKSVVSELVSYYEFCRSKK